MDLGLSNKVALVTAASRGLGMAAAMAFAREGARLCISSHSEEIQSAADIIGKETGQEVLALQSDLTKSEAIKSLVKDTLDRYGRIDILVINAGGPPPGNFLSLKPEDWERAIDQTLMSAVHLCYSVLPHMIEQGEGSIVATQSLSVKQPIENLILSNSIRMAVIGLMKSLANELGPQGIRVNSINPGWTKTGRVEQLLADRALREKSSQDEEAAKIAVEVPLGRMGTVEEYGRAIAWLASPAASYIHGHALMFDGGATRTAL